MAIEASITGSSLLLISFLELGKLFLAVLTLAFLGIFYSRWHFVRRNLVMFFALVMLVVSFGIDFLKFVIPTASFFETSLLIHDLLELFFVMAFGYAYYKMMKMTRRESISK